MVIHSNCYLKDKKKLKKLGHKIECFLTVICLDISMVKSDPDETFNFSSTKRVLSDGTQFYLLSKKKFKNYLFLINMSDSMDTLVVSKCLIKKKGLISENRCLYTYFSTKYGN